MLVKPLAAAAMILVAAAPGLAHAGDSSWLWCHGIAEHGKPGDVERTHFAASLHEHRAGADHRDLSVTLVYGVHESHGEIAGKQAGEWLGKPTKLVVKSVAGRHAVTFSGTAELATDLATFALNGTIDFTFGRDARAARVPFTAKLTCETLDDLAIGH